MAEEGLLVRADALERTASVRLEAQQARYPRRIAGVRGTGAMIAYDLVDETGAQGHRRGAALGVAAPSQ
jgi:4-aminobutyrate aminotransferase-like enzyme